MATARSAGNERRQNDEPARPVASGSRRSGERRLREREQQLRRVIDAMPMLVAQCDRHFRLTFVNRLCADRYGYRPENLIGKPLPEIIGGPAFAAVRPYLEAALNGEAQEQELRSAIAGDEERYLHLIYVPETDSQGRVESVVGLVYEVTARARMEKERDELLARERSARIQAEIAARARDEFLAIVSHELRAPLNGIQSWAHVLENQMRDSELAPLAHRALHGIKTGVGQQVRLIEDLLDVTRMMSGKLRLIRQALPLLPALQAAAQSVRAMANAKQITVQCAWRITTEQIDGDADRIQQIFWNLLSNAVKFTPEGGHVWLSAGCTGTEICVTVRDDGIGISADFLPHLFNRFSQEDTSCTRGQSGLGLGLFLVRHLVELHGGRVTAESPGEGQGSTLSVHFPLRARSDPYLTVAPVEECERLPLPSLTGLLVLLIDDQEEARASLSEVLSAAGASVFAASSSTHALDWLQTRASDQLPNVLICDIAMPGEDGYAVLRKIRTWKRGDSTPLQRMPALAVTAFAQREDRIRALTAGFQMHLTKPISPEELIVVIDTMVGRG